MLIRIVLKLEGTTVFESLHFFVHPLSYNMIHDK